MEVNAGDRIRTGSQQAKVCVFHLIPPFSARFITPGRRWADKSAHVPQARFVTLTLAAPHGDIESFWPPSPPVFPGEKGWG